MSQSQSFLSTIPINCIRKFFYLFIGKVEACEEEYILSTGNLIRQTNLVTSDGLPSHMQTHSLDRPYKWDVCGKGFKQSHNLNSHKKIHTEDQPKNHLCTVCDCYFNENVCFSRERKAFTW